MDGHPGGLARARPGVAAQHGSARGDGRMLSGAGDEVGPGQGLGGGMMEMALPNLWDATDPLMIEAFIGGYGIPSYDAQDDLASAAGQGAEQNDSLLLRRLHTLVEESSENWTYGIFWQLSLSPAGES